MLILCEATEDELDFMTQIDLEDEGMSQVRKYSQADFDRSRKRLAGYLKSDSDAVWVFKDEESSKCNGLIIFRYRDLEKEPVEEANQLLEHLPRNVFPNDGKVTEIYQLWVDPEFRRRGLGTQLKRQAEIESKKRSISMIYTHTEETNAHIIDLNVKLGYEKVRRGRLGDVDRVSLIKQVI